MDDADRRFLTDQFQAMKLDHRLRTEKLSEAFCKILDRKDERIAVLERVVEQAIEAVGLSVHYSNGSSEPDGISGYFEGWCSHPERYPDLYNELKSKEQP